MQLHREVTSPSADTHAYIANKELSNELQTAPTGQAIIDDTALIKCSQLSKQTDWKEKMNEQNELSPIYLNFNLNGEDGKFKYLKIN